MPHTEGIPLPQGLFFIAVGQVARIAEPRNDIRMAGELFILRGHPQGDALAREMFLEIFHSIYTGHRAHEMGIRRRAVLKKPVVCQLQGSPGSQHGISQDKDFPVKVGGGHIFYVDMEIISLVIFPVGGHKSILGVIEEIKYPLVQRESGPQYGGDHYLVIMCADIRDAQRRHDLLFRIVQPFAYFIGEDSPHTLQVGPEPHAVLLHSPVPHLCNEPVEDRILFSEIDDFHDSKF